MSRYQFSVGLTSTVTSLLKDDEDFQIVHAQQLLTYLSNKGYNPPEIVVNILLDLLRAKRSNDEALAFQIIEILDVFKDSYFSGLDTWDLLLIALVSLRCHLSGEDSNDYPKEKRFQFLISKLMVSYFISTLSTVAHDVDSNRNRRSKLIDEILNLMQYCDLDTFRELINFLIIIYNTSRIPHLDTVPDICTGFKAIKQFNRRVLFCQLLPAGKAKNQLIVEFIEDIFPSSHRKNSGNPLIEDISIWFKKLVKNNFKKHRPTNSHDNDSLNDSMESTKSLYSMDLDLQEPVGVHELFVLLCSQLYQSSIITASELENSSTEERKIQWDSIYHDFKSFSDCILDFIGEDSRNVSNSDLIKNVLNDLNIIIQYKSTTATK